MNSKLQYEPQPSNDNTQYKIKLFSNDLVQILSLTTVRGQDIPYPEQCQYCKLPHNFDGQHNLVIKQYFEAQFISDLIAEHHTLFLICNWAHKILKNQSSRVQDKAWHHILQNNFYQVNNFMTDDEKCILNSLRPFGAGEYLFDFMQLSNHQNENWVLALETLNQLTNSSQYQNNKLFKWATCQSVPWSGDASKFYEILWLNLRAQLFCRVMTRHSEIYPKMMQCINFGINKPYVWQPKHYELNYKDFNYGIENYGKKLIVLIIEYLTKQSTAIELIQFVQEAIYSLSNLCVNAQESLLKAKCFYDIGQMIVNLLDVDKDDECQFLELLTEIITLMEIEIFDTTIKFNYLISLLSVLTRQTSYNFFICQMCQKIFNQIGDSLGYILQQLIDCQFEKILVTTIAFDQFEELTISQQNELISKKFSQYFDYNERRSSILRLFPYIVQNINLFEDQFLQLLQDYPELDQLENEYYQVYKQKNIERMKSLILEVQIPYYWFIKYIIFMLENPNLIQEEMYKKYIFFSLDIIEGISQNHQLFDKLENKREILSLIAKKLTGFQNFIDYLIE